MRDTSPRRSTFSLAIFSGTNCRSPLGTRQATIEFFEQLPAELRQLLGLLEQRVPRVHDTREQRLWERTRQRLEVRRVEVHADGLYVELEKLAQNVARVPEQELQRDRQWALQDVERIA